MRPKTDSEKLRVLVDWFDLHDKREGKPIGGITDGVQTDLRRMADTFEKIRETLRITDDENIVQEIEFLQRPEDKENTAKLHKDAQGAENLCGNDR